MNLETQETQDSHQSQKIDINSWEIIGPLEHRRNPVTIENISKVNENKIEKMYEDIQRFDIKNKALNTLLRINRDYPNMILYEIIYQSYKIKFSDSYFSGSMYNFGESIVDYMINQHDIGNIVGFGNIIESIINNTTFF